MDENTITYLLTSIGIHCGKIDEARRYGSALLISRTASMKLKIKQEMYWRLLKELALKGRIIIMNRVKAFVQKIWTYDLVHTAVYSIVLELIVECFNRRGIMGLAFPFMHPIIFIYNTLIIMTSMALALFFRRRMFVYSVVSVFGLDWHLLIL